MKYQIVVARYNEDVSFLNNHKDIVKVVNTYLYVGNIFSNLSECYVFER